jgi:hypothetical protein
MLSTHKILTKYKTKIIDMISCLPILTPSMRLEKSVWVQTGICSCSTKMDLQQEMHIWEYPPWQIIVNTIRVSRFAEQLLD